MLKNELKNKILNDLNNYDYYEIKNDDEITNNEKITIDRTQYNIITIMCDECEGETRYITKMNYDDLSTQLVYDNVYKSYNGMLICETCYNDNFTECDNCGELIRLDDDDYVELSDGRRYCCDCGDNYTFYCDDCGEHYDTRDHNYYETIYNTTICDDCRFDNYIECEHCGDVVSMDDARYDDTNDAYYCETCYSNLFFDYLDVYTDTNDITGDINTDCVHSAVLDYHQHPRDFIKRVGTGENYDANNLYFGVELETSVDDFQKQKNASCFIAKNLNCIINYDGSVCGYPMEIISDPQTINKWDERHEKISKMFSILKDYGVTSHDNNTCGLHVHVSRAGLGETFDEQTRVINNIILILENFKQNIIKLTRRTPEQLNMWSQFISDYNGGDDLRDVEKIKKCDKAKRKLALNLTNSQTIEFRLFRGTLSIDTFYATLHLVNNIIELAKRDDIRGVSFKQLIHLNNYNDLIEYAKQRECDNAVTIINRGNKTLKIEQKQRRDNLRKYVRSNVFKTGIINGLLEHNDIIERAINYMNRNTPRRELERMLNIQADPQLALIEKNYNCIMDVLRYNTKSFYTPVQRYDYIDSDDIKKVNDLYNELVAVIKAVI